MVVPTDIDDLPAAELRRLVAKLLAENAKQRRVIAELREEIARLKGLKGRPDVKLSGMDKGTSAKPGGRRDKRRGRGKVVPRTAAETETLRVTRPAGSRFKGYEPYLVQELVLGARVLRGGRAARSRRWRWLGPAVASGNLL